MTTKAIDPPNLQLNTAQLVDWLELSALFSEYGVVRMDALVGALKQLAEEQEEDIAEADKLVEKFIEDIENEFELRVDHLKGTYPFKLDSDAEEMQLVPDWEDQKYSFYLVCLVTSHVTASPILKTPPEGSLLIRLRNEIFQILATLAMAGFARGPAITVGWPRKSGETVLKRMAVLTSWVGPQK
jgi:hypothetical protein